jgi:hypothetical protein
MHHPQDPPGNALYTTTAGMQELPLATLLLFDMLHHHVMIKALNMFYPASRLRASAKRINPCYMDRRGDHIIIGCVLLVGGCDRHRRYITWQAANVLKISVCCNRSSHWR